LELNLHQIEQLKHDIAKKTTELKDLEELHHSYDLPEVTTFCDGKFTNEIRHTIMALVLEHGVSQKKVNDVITTVLTNLSGQTLSRLPSTGVKSRLLIEARRVANQHTLEELLKEQTFTVHQDGTTKHHIHFQGYQVTSSEGKTLTLGLNEISDGTGQTIFNNFESLLNELAECIEHKNKRENWEK